MVTSIALAVLVAAILNQVFIAHEPKERPLDGTEDGCCDDYMRPRKPAATLCNICGNPAQKTYDGWWCSWCENEM